MSRRKSPKNNADIEQAIPSNGESMASNPTEIPLESVAAPSLVTNATKARIGKNGRKTGLTNLVPVNMDDEIRSLAYLLSERRGFEPGHETEDWLNAEREVLGRYHQQRA
jgi:hypothetical protein